MGKKKNENGGGIAKGGMGYSSRTNNKAESWPKLQKCKNAWEGGEEATSKRAGNGEKRKGNLENATSEIMSMPPTSKYSLVAQCFDRCPMDHGWRGHYSAGQLNITVQSVLYSIMVTSMGILEQGDRLFLPPSTCTLIILSTRSFCLF